MEGMKEVEMQRCLMEERDVEKREKERLLREIEEVKRGKSSVEEREKIEELERKLGEEKGKREEGEKEKEELRKARDAAIAAKEEAIKANSKTERTLALLRPIIDIPNNPGLLNGLSSGNEHKAKDAAGALFNMVCYKMDVPDAEEHPLFIPMKENGSLEKIYQLFKEAQFPLVKRDLCYIFINVHRTKEFEWKHKEMIIYLRDNTNQSTDPFHCQTTLVISRQHV
jgi:predicted RNase H-like nuclease (RuvC/YqgF family)